MDRWTKRPPHDQWQKAHESEVEDAKRTVQVAPFCVLGGLPGGSIVRPSDSLPETPSKARKNLGFPTPFSSKILTFSGQIIRTSERPYHR